MGVFVSGPVLVEDARAYDDYSARVARIMTDLVGRGRIPDSDTVVDYISLNRLLWSACREQAEAASARGVRTFVARLPLTDREHRMFGEMGESLGALMEVIALRADVDVAPPEGATRFGEAIAVGSYHADEAV